jgi:hypothetical protein
VRAGGVCDRSPAQQGCAHKRGGPVVVIVSGAGFSRVVLTNGDGVGE